MRSPKLVYRIFLEMTTNVWGSRFYQTLPPFTLVIVVAPNSKVFSLDPIIGALSLAF